MTQQVQQITIATKNQSQKCVTVFFPHHNVPYSIKTEITWNTAHIRIVNPSLLLVYQRFMQLLVNRMLSALPSLEVTVSTAAKKKKREVI